VAVYTIGPFLLSYLMFFLTHILGLSRKAILFFGARFSGSFQIYAAANLLFGFGATYLGYLLSKAGT